MFTNARLRKVGPDIAIGALAAGVFDVIENLTMLGYLNGWFGFSGWPPLAGLMAVPKFILVLIALVYVLMGVVATLVGSVRNKRTS